MAPKKITPRKLPAKKKKPQTVVTVNVDLLTPEVFYQLQKALQDAGVILIDLDEGTVIDGQINSLEIGMIHPLTPPKVKPTFGFHSFLPNNKVEYYPKRDVDATLCQFPEVQDKGPTPFMFKIFLDSDLDIWIDIIAKIAPQFITKGRGGIMKPTIYLSITSLGVAGKDKLKMLELLQRKLQHYRTSEPGMDVPDLFHIYDFEADFDDDDEEY